MGTALLPEREEELGALRDGAARAARGHGSLILISGGLGVGKSALLASVADLAGEHGMRLLQASGSRTEREFAYGVVHQLFEPAFDAHGLQKRWLTGPAAGARTLFGDHANVGESDPEALCCLLSNMAGDGPLALTIDDLQWLDPPSLRWLAALAGHLESLPVLMVATFSDGDPAVGDAPV